MPSPEFKSGKTEIITITPTLTVHAGYVTGDYVGKSAESEKILGAAMGNGGGGWIISALLIDAVLANKAGELWVFESAITPPADSAAWTLSDADAAKCLGVFNFAAADYKSSALNSVCQNSSTDKVILFKTAADSKDLYYAFVTRDAPGYSATGDLKIRLEVQQDSM